MSSQHQDLLADLSSSISVYSQMPSLQSLYQVVPLREIIAATLQSSINEISVPPGENVYLNSLLDERFSRRSNNVDLDAYYLLCEDLMQDLDSEIGRKYPVYSEDGNFVFAGWVDRYTVRLTRKVA